ncbi:putative ser arg-related nuclear matrix protein [Neofusicoccum parvum UCRNP2]|uniref:Putative ser arg-related nuclear matrix protein n=1 Tax=Botryosphaeria parva (strain UCR-NP2) TaxID=1287680 RepID=R1GGN2_BOTPV|nr:putative ser arg-related nuclear matrix protein [Neofusicoccum parvum UCRNP2]
MAYRDYDDRPRYSSRRYYEPDASRARDYEHVKGRQYPHDPYDRRRTEYYQPDQRRTASQADYDDRYADDYPYANAYDLRDRDRYPPTPPPTASYRVERRRRASWPPCPTAEDLEIALAREADHALRDRKRGDEAPNRGAIDQEPILEEVEEEMARFNQERRFVIVPGSDGSA